MKINFVQTIIAIAVSLLIAYGLYSFHDSENKILLSAGSFVFLATTLVLTIGTSFQLQGARGSHSSAHLSRWRPWQRPCTRSFLTGQKVRLPVRGHL